MNRHAISPMISIEIHFKILSTKFIGVDGYKMVANGFAWAHVPTTNLIVSKETKIFNYLSSVLIPKNKALLPMQCWQQLFR